MLTHARLPAFVTATSLTSPGLDNHLTLAVLADGRRVLLRQPHVPLHDAGPRWAFLESLGVTRPRVHATTPDGASLVEWVDGRPLGELVARGQDHRAWFHAGAALARVHGTTFPGHVAGDVGAAGADLPPVDPVAEAHATITRVEPWVLEHVPGAERLLTHLHDTTTALSAEVLRDGSRLLHGDISLGNIIVTGADAVLIDWDAPRAGCRFTELAALEEHLYLATGADALPPEFARGYACTVSPAVVRLFRVLGCAGWLASDDWSVYAAHPRLTQERKTELASWRPKLLRWLQEQSEAVAGG